ncbi:MAG: phasin [Methyloligellaceae bacterium]
MNKTGNFEIPEQIRDLAEQSMEKAEEAYKGFVDAANKAQTMLKESSENVTSGTKEIQDKAFSYASENMQANFDLAARLIKAKDMKEALEIQSDFAKKQMETYSKQAQDIGKLVGDVAQKAKPKT